MSGIAEDLPRRGDERLDRLALAASRLLEPLGALAGERFLLPREQLLSGREQLLRALRLVPRELVDRPDRDRGLPQRRDTVRLIRLAGLLEPLREVVAGGRELLERTAVEVVELALEVGDDGEIGPAQAAFNASTSSSFRIFE
jgi:hypothetical protein